MANLTVKQLESLNASDSGRKLPDGESMFGMVHVAKDHSVSVSFEWRYKFDGKVRQLRVGTWPKLTLGEIRRIRNDFREQVKGRASADPDKAKAAVDPIQAKETARMVAAAAREAATLKAQADAAEAVQAQRSRLTEQAAMQARMTVRELFERWHKLALRDRVDKGSESRRSFEADVFPIIGAMATEDVRKTHVQAILDTMRERATDDKPMVRARKAVLGDLRQMFHWALERDYLETDPTAVISKGKLGKNVERDRYLAESELIVFFQKLPLAGLAETSRMALMIQLSTAARIGEILSARWEHVDMDSRLWFLPDTKNDRDHTVHLSDFALRQFRQLKKITGFSTWLFPNTNKAESVCLKTVTKQVADRQRVDRTPMSGRTMQTNALILPGGKWTPHDLRRTAATIMAMLGVLDIVVDKCLNHVEPNKVRRTYNRFAYQELMQDAWNRLGSRLEALEAKSKVEFNSLDGTNSISA